MKSNRAAAKRFKVTASGKIKREKAFRGHLLTGKTAKNKRQLRGDTYVADGDLKRVKRMLLAE
jgi:large subunit ribosomal protein L35